MYQQYNIVDVKNPFEEEDTTAVIVCSLHVHSSHTRVATTHSDDCLRLTKSSTTN